VAEDTDKTFLVLAGIDRTVHVVDLVVQSDTLERVQLGTTPVGGGIQLGDFGPSQKAIWAKNINLYTAANAFRFKVVLPTTKQKLGLTAARMWEWAT
jgi:hypothetical protein